MEKTKSRQKSIQLQRKELMQRRLKACKENSFILGRTKAFSFLVFPKLKPNTLLNNDLKRLIMINIILRANDSSIIAFNEGDHTYSIPVYNDLQDSLYNRHNVPSSVPLNLRTSFKT